MVYTKTVIDRRSALLYNGVSDKNIGDYIKRLRTTLKDIDVSFGFRQIVKISDSLLEEIKETINEEIKNCLFYFEFKKRQRKEENFNKWVSVKEKDRQKFFPDEYNWEKYGDCWTKTNGKIRAVININSNRGKRTKVSLQLRNDSDVLQFLDSSGERGYKHLSNQDSIDRQIQVYKEEAEQLFKEHLYPRYSPEKRNMELLNELLHVGEVEK